AMRAGGDSGPAVVAGNAEKSLLLDRVLGRNGARRMPPASDGEPLSERQVAVLKRWIDQGAAGPADEKPEADPRVHPPFPPRAPPPRPPPPRPRGTPLPVAPPAGGSFWPPRGGAARPPPAGPRRPPYPAAPRLPRPGRPAADARRAGGVPGGRRPRPPGKGGG